MKLIGILLIVNSIAVSVWWIATSGSHKGSILTLCFLGVFAGIAILINERITEFSVKGIGTIKAAAKQVSADANEVAKLKKRVEDQSATVNLVAKEAADAKQLVEALSEKNEKAEEKLAQLDKSIHDGNLAVNELKLYTYFNSIVLAAQNDNRKAYDQLWGWSKDSSFPFQKSATQAVQSIMDKHHPAIVRGSFKVEWNEGIEPDKLPLSELQRQFFSAPPHIRLGIMEFICEKRPDILQIDRLNFLLEVLRRDESLQVVEYAGRYFAKETGDKLKPIAISPHLEWWEKNKDSFK